MQSSPPPLETTWVCNACSARNFASERECQRCELSKSDNERVLPLEQRRGKPIRVGGRVVYARNDARQPVRSKAEERESARRSPSAEHTDDLIRELLELGEQQDRETRYQRERRRKRRSTSSSYGRPSGWKRRKRSISNSDDYKRRSRSYSDKRRSRSRSRRMSRRRRRRSSSRSASSSTSRSRSNSHNRKSSVKRETGSVSPDRKSKRKHSRSVESRHKKSESKQKDVSKREISSSTSVHRKRRKRRRESSGRRRRDYSSSSRSSSPYRGRRDRRRRGRRRRRSYSRSASSSRGGGRRRRRRSSSDRKFDERLRKAKKSRKGATKADFEPRKRSSSESSDYGPFIRPNLAPTGVAASKMMFGKSEVMVKKQKPKIAIRVGKTSPEKAPINFKPIVHPLTSLVSNPTHQQPGFVYGNSTSYIHHPTFVMKPATVRSEPATIQEVPMDTNSD